MQLQQQAAPYSDWATTLLEQCIFTRCSPLTHHIDFCKRTFRRFLRYQRQRSNWMNSVESGRTHRSPSHPSITTGLFAAEAPFQTSSFFLARATIGGNIELPGLRSTRISPTSSALLPSFLHACAGPRPCFLNGRSGTFFLYLGIFAPELILSNPFHIKGSTCVMRPLPFGARQK